MKVYLWPFFGGEDNGEGGVRRVLEKQTRYLPNYGVDIVTDPEEADVIAFHILQDPDVVRRFPNKPIVAHCHGLYWSEYEWQNWAKKTNRDVLNLLLIADIITTPSEWVSQVVRRHTARRVMTVYHGVEMDEFPPGENQGYVLWNKNRTDPVCDPWPMQAVAQLLPEVKFVSTHGEKTKNVVITDTVPYEEAKEYVRNAGVYLATTRETFGIGTIEAMAAGVPVVGYSWGGQREIITHEVDGWLCQPDDIDGLAEGIQWAIKNREQAGAAARSTAERFTWERSCELYKEAYERAYAYRNSKSEQRAQPLVSVIVPAYNREETLARTLTSVVSQTMTDWECVIVDDGSTDETGKIADVWAQDERFKVVHHETNQHVSAARNTGVENSRGKYIIQVDSDDELTPNALDILSSELEKDRNLHITYGNLLFVDEKDVPINYSEDPGHSGWPMEYNFEWHIHRGMNLLPYCSMYRREVWELTGGYRTRYRTGEDADFWMRAASYGFKPKMLTKEDVLIYHVSESSLSATEPKIPWEDWYPWKRYENLVLAGAANNVPHPEVTSFEPIIVSVVIPVGPGHEKYVIDAIDSVQAQTFPNWECIVVNDSEYELPNLPSWVRVIDNHWGPHGPAAARNRGIEEAKGKLFLPLDADDYLQPNALDTMMKIWMENTDKIVYCDHFDDQVEEGVFEIHHNPDYDPNILIRNGCLHSVTALTLKEVWEKVGGYDEELLAWEDWGFQLSCASIGICEIHAPYPLFTYRKHTGRRRNDNYDKFEVSKSSILGKFGRYFGENREELMACGSCGGGNKQAFSLPPTVSMKLQQPPADDAVLLRCNREGDGELTYRGPSGNQYLFANGHERYVLREDVQHFLDRGFTVAIHNEIRQEPVLSTSLQHEPQRELASVGATPSSKPMFAFDDLPTAPPVSEPDHQWEPPVQEQPIEPQPEAPVKRRAGRPPKNAR